MPVPEKDVDKIAHIALPIGTNNVLLATDALDSWQPRTFGNNSYILLETDTDQEADRLFDSLSDAGRVDMPLQKTEWAEKYGTWVDRFGVQGGGHACNLRFGPNYYRVRRAALSRQAPGPGLLRGRPRA
jgi:PhnB protein